LIVLTVGTQLPFDRLVNLVDQAALSIPETIFGQIGKTSLTPRNFAYAQLLSPEEFHQKVSESRVIVGHAGMGTLLTAAKYGKPAAIMARRKEFSEHRNDHQLATVEQMRKIQGVYTFDSSDELIKIATTEYLQPMSSKESIRRSNLVINLKNYITSNGW
jgi:UDP-N-acetylglucosamine transferase subunit ALG13